MITSYFNANFTIATLHDSNYSELAEITLPNKTLYCEKHGYNLISKTNNWNDIPIGYEKFFLIKEIFEKNPYCKWVFFSECDTLITNMDITLENIIKDEPNDIVLTSDFNGINVGSFFIKNSPIGIKFLDVIKENVGKFSNELEFIDSVYKQPEWQNLISVYPSKVFNAYNYHFYNRDPREDGNWLPGYFMIHTPSLPVNTRIDIVKECSKSIINTDFLLKRDIKTPFGSNSIIRSNDEDAVNHFSNRASFADFIIDQININKIYDEYLTKKNLVIFDLGANVGLFSLHASESASVIYSFEPTPEHFKLLTEFTRGYDNIKPINAAISDKDGDLCFYKCSENNTMNSLVNLYNEKIIVKGVNLLTFINEHKIKKVDFVKCDIEGGEMVAFSADIVKSLRDRVSCWFIEAHNTTGRPGDTVYNRSLLHKIFEEAGYKCKLIGDDTLYAYN